jgi:ethanolamine-phosphate cytidylyltransferase
MERPTSPPRSAKQRGDFLIVGIHGDAAVNKRRGVNLPLLNLNERVLSVLGCRYVDDVLIDAPYVVTSTMIRALNISEVVHGTNTDALHDHQSNGAEDERYQHAKAANIFSILDSPSDFKLGSIIQRIRRNQEFFQSKFNRKMEAENLFYEQKYDENATAPGTHTANNVKKI